MTLKNRENQLQKRGQIIGKIASYLIAENFSTGHLYALIEIILLFNHSEAAKKEVFIFAAELCNKYGYPPPKEYHE